MGKYPLISYHLHIIKNRLKNIDLKEIENILNLTSFDQKVEIAVGSSNTELT